MIIKEVFVLRSWFHGWGYETTLPKILSLQEGVISHQHRICVDIWIVRILQIVWTTQKAEISEEIIPINWASMVGFHTCQLRQCVWMHVLSAHTAPWGQGANLHLLFMLIVLQIAAFPYPFSRICIPVGYRPGAGKCLSFGSYWSHRIDPSSIKEDVTLELILHFKRKIGWNELG